MMRDVVLKIAALVLAACYLMSIIGFGVHTCMGSERSFLTTFVSAAACEDIHPEHHCADSHHCCGHEGDDVSFMPADCCSDDFIALALTGTVPPNENDNAGCPCGACFHAAELLSDSHIPSVRSVTYRMFSPPDSGCIVPGDVQSVLGIWRI